MTPSLAPSLLGPAPPANAPPRVDQAPASRTSKASSGEQDSRETFAAQLETAKQSEAPPADAATQGGDETPSPTTTATTMPPTGGAPTTEDAPTADELLARLLALAQGLTEEGAPTDATDEPTTNLLLDRLAEAGGSENQTDATALDATADVLEALMAYLVMGQQPQVTPDATTALPDDLVALLQRIEGAVSGAADATAELLGQAAPLAGSALTEAPEVPADLDASPDTGTAVAEAEAILAESAPTGAATPDVPAPSSDLPVDLAPVQPATATAASDAGAAEVAATTVAETGATNTETRERSSDGGEGDTGVELILPQPSATDVAGVDASADAQAAAAQASTSQPARDVRVVTVAEPRIVDAASMQAEVADIVRMASITGDSEIRLVLNPPDLGHLDINITRGEHGLRITVEAAQAGARDLLDRSMPGLHQALEARDLRVDRLEVRSADTGRGSLDTTGGGQHPGGQQQSGWTEDAPEWSPVAGLGGVTGTSDSGSRTEPSRISDGSGRAADGPSGSVDLLA